MDRELGENKSRSTAGDTLLRGVVTMAKTKEKSRVDGIEAADGDTNTSQVEKVIVDQAAGESIGSSESDDLQEPRAKFVVSEKDAEESFNNPGARDSTLQGIQAHLVVGLAPLQWY
ncbi:hypothetical protein SUGI_0605170 [Cryptomeria japonica]|nr:hypothetical protein SUGI_0605170 [Cryptomeria japonica]